MNTIGEKIVAALRDHLGTSAQLVNDVFEDSTELVVVVERVLRGEDFTCASFSEAKMNALREEQTRDTFATAAMQAYISQNSASMVSHARETAAAAFDVADEMMRERAQRQLRRAGGHF